jgi:hypothetical protein
MKLAINLCTRGRPDLLLQTIERTLPNISREDTVLMISADEDDELAVTALAHRGWTGGFSEGGVITDIRPREGSLGAKYNRALERVPDATCFLAMVDYAPHITPGFDQKILDAAALFPDGIGVVYNRYANMTFPQINAVTKRWCELQGGYFYPPYFPYWFIDHWLDDIARITGRIAYADVEIDTAPRPGTQNMRDLAFWSEFFARLYIERRRIAHDIIKVLDEPDWRKQLLYAHHPPIEQRSLWVSQGVTQGAAETERQMGAKDAPDAEYLRLRAAAEAMMGLKAEAA